MKRRQLGIDTPLRVGAHRSRRRLIGAVAALGLVRSAGAQTRAIPRIGYLFANDRASNAWEQGIFESSLAKLGWTVGRDVVLEYRYGDGDAARIAASARALVALKPDILVTGGSAGAIPLRALTDTIPIVGTNLADPVGAGLARSLARPGGNVTGMAVSMGTGILGKRLQMLRAFVPRARRVAVLRVPGEYTAPHWQELSESARALDVSLLPFDGAGDGFPAAFPAIASARPDAMCLVGQGTILQRMQSICDFALRERLPATYALKPFAQAGLLFTYGVDLTEGFRRSASFVDRILRGAQPAELPIEQPNRYELTINRKTADLLNVRVPQDLLFQADEVIG